MRMAEFYDCPHYGLCTFHLYTGKCKEHCARLGEGKRMTNYERIKAMSVEEMAEYFWGDCFGCEIEKRGMCESILDCKAQRIRWLESECDT